MKSNKIDKGLEKWAESRKVGFKKFFLYKFLILACVLYFAILFNKIIGINKVRNDYFYIVPIVSAVIVLVVWFWNEYRFKKFNKKGK